MVVFTTPTEITVFPSGRCGGGKCNCIHLLHWEKEGDHTLRWERCPVSQKNCVHSRFIKDFLCWARFRFTLLSVSILHLRYKLATVAEIAVWGCLVRWEMARPWRLGDDRTLRDTHARSFTHSLSLSLSQPTYVPLFHSPPKWSLPGLIYIIHFWHLYFIHQSHPGSFSRSRLLSEHVCSCVRLGTKG